MVENSTQNLGNPLLSYRASQIVVKDVNQEQREPRVLVPPTRPKSSPHHPGLEYRWKRALIFQRRRTILIGERRHSRRDRSRDTQRAIGIFVSKPFFGSQRNSRCACVLVRTTDVVPDELVKLDLKTGALTVVASPNDVFRSKVQPKVRFVPIECCDADFHGRLYLPTDYEQGKRYPLVFTNYVSGLGFDHAHPSAMQGIADWRWRK